MQLKMCKMQYVLIFLTIYLGLVHSSWYFDNFYGKTRTDDDNYVPDALQNFEFAISKINRNVILYYSNYSAIDAFYFSETIKTPIKALAYAKKRDMFIRAEGAVILGASVLKFTLRRLIERPDGNIHGIAFDPVTDTVFFTDTNERTVNWFSVKNIDEFDLIHTGTDSFEYDEYNHVMRGYLLIKMDEGIPRDIVVDSCRGYVYWLNTDMTNPTIERARFSGAEREVFVHTTSLPFNATHKLEPHSLAIDHRTQAIYWFEPYSTTQYNMVRCDLNTREKTRGVYYQMKRFPMIAHPPNTLTVSNGLFYLVDINSERKLYIFPLILNDYSRFRQYLIDESHVSLAVRNYDIQEIQDCEISPINIATNATFCAHGLKVDGESVCECAPGYTGERCDVYVCTNYCLRGWCRINNRGLPECRCHHGYAGVRCQINKCNGYCLNGGKCFRKKEGNPVCQCVGSYKGSRCETDETDSFSCVKAGDLTLSDILSNLQKSEKNSICLKTI